MALMERDVVLTGRMSDGAQTLDLPVTRLGNVENAADTKASVDASDYIPVIDMVNKGQMKKITVKALANAVARMITR